MTWFVSGSDWLTIMWARYLEMAHFRVGADILVFTFDTSDEMDSWSEYFLKPNGRYSHTLNYVKRILASHQLNLVHFSPVVIREEFKKPVNGYVITALNPSRWRYPYSPH